MTKDWRSDAACVGHDPGMWDLSSDEHSNSRARQICRTKCPVIDTCTKLAIENKEVHHIFGWYESDPNGARYKIKECTKCGDKFVPNNRLRTNCPDCFVPTRSRYREPLPERRCAKPMCYERFRPVNNLHQWCVKHQKHRGSGKLMSCGYEPCEVEFRGRNGRKYCTAKCASRAQQVRKAAA